MNNKLLNKIFNQGGLHQSLTAYDDREKAQGSIPSIDVVESKEKYLFGKELDIPEEPIEDETDAPRRDDKKESSITLSRNKKKVFSYFDQESKMIGKITEVDKDNAVFVVQASNTSDGITREMQFSFSEVEKSEYPKITEGRRVIFVYGKQYVNGTQYNLSKLYFRDAPVWSKRELEKRRRNMMQLFEGIDDEDDSVG